MIRTFYLRKESMTLGIQRPDALVKNERYRILIFQVDWLVFSRRCHLG